MKIILLQNDKNLGQKYEIKEVKEGYGKNFLIPRGLACLATAANLKNLTQQKISEEKRQQKTKEILEQKAIALKKICLEFTLKIGEKQQVFGSVTASEIEEKLNELGFADVKVLLEKPIKELGDFTAPIDLGNGVKNEIKIKIRLPLPPAF